MERAQFEAMVKRLEEYSAREPQSYRRRVGLLAALGYGYVLLVLAIVLLAIAALVWIVFVGHHLNALLVKLGIFLFIFAFIILRSLWVRFPAPEGLALERAQVPQLFAMIDELTTKLQAPRFHHVLLVDDFNAAVAQRPRLGMLGWQENYLLLGLPLMQALTPDQFRAVVAHEFGHLSGNHGRFGGWIYRIYQTWEQVLNSFAQAGHSGGWVFEKFLRWYAPFFGAYSFVLRRADEYVADRCAAELTNAPTAAAALVNLELKDRFLQERFWSPIFKSVAEQAEPPSAPFSKMAAALSMPFASTADTTTAVASTVAASTNGTVTNGTATNAAATASSDQSTLTASTLHQWLARAFREKTGYSDTHPSLSDRLKALGYDQSAKTTLLEEVQNGRAPISAAAFFLAEKEKELTTQLDRTWHKTVAPEWQVQHQRMQEAANKLQGLDEKAAHETLSNDEAWERASLTASLRGNADAVPLVRDVIRERPDFAPAHYMLGEILLENEDDTGIAALERAVELDSDAALPVYNAIYNFLLDRGREEDAAQYREKAYSHQDEIEKAIEERSIVTERDEFLPPQLSPEEQQRLQALLISRPDIAEAYAACKRVQHFGDKPMHVLALVRKKASAFKLSQDDDQFMASAIESLQSWEEAPFSYVFVSNGSTKKLFAKISSIDGAKVYADASS